MVPATMHGLPDGGEPEGGASRGDAPPSIESSWLDLIDDLGPFVLVDEALDAPGLEERLAARGARRTDAVDEATTVVLSASSPIDPSSLVDHVTVAVLAANRWRLRRGADAAVRDRAIPSTSLRRIRRRVGGDMAFGLFPSAGRPHCALDVRSPAAARYAVDALSVHVGDGQRRSLLRVVRLAVRRQWLFLFPAWLVVRHGVGRADGPRVSAQFSYGHNEGLTRFVGEPPQWVEREASRRRVETERRILAELDGGGGLTPRICSTSRPAVVATSLASGRPLDLQSLGDAQVEAWTERAAAALARLQHLTRHDDGTVIVHGDFWLGNVMVEGDRVVAVLDWEESRRGEDTADVDFLVRSYAEFVGRQDDEVLARRLRAAVARGLDAAPAGDG